MPNPTIRCATCYFWSRNLKPGATNGQCRRYPPVNERTDQGLRPMWPMTEDYGWCGEHGAVEILEVRDV
jgi:hypothetical protein